MSPQGFIRGRVRLMRAESIDTEYDYDYDTDSESDSNSESEDELPSFNRWERRPEPERDPALGIDENGNVIRGPQGQNRWHSTNLWRSGKPKKLLPLRNVTIAFAKHMMESGGVPKGTSTEGQALIHRLLDIDRKRNNPDTAPQPEAPLLRKHVRLSAKKMFPGKTPKGKPLLWTFSGKNPVSQAGHFRKVQFQRMLYDDGVDADVIQACKGNLELATLWQKHRDQFHPLEGSELDVSTSDFDVKSGDSDMVSEGVIDYDDMDVVIPTVEFDSLDGSSNSLEPISMAAKYAMQPLPYLATPPRRNPQVASGTFRSPAASRNRPSSGSLSAIPNPPGRKKAPGHASPTSHLIALAARVNRYPLALPGNNNGRPLTMHRNGKGTKPKPVWTTYRAKYSKSMIVQLLKDYDVLPANVDQMAGDVLCQHLVSEREKLYAGNVPLQEAWTNERLQGYVDEQEARGLIPPVSSGKVWERASGRLAKVLRDGNRSSPLNASMLLSGRHGYQTGAVSGKRSWEGDDSDSEFEEPMAKKARKLSKDPNSWLWAPLESSPVSYLGFKNGLSHGGPMTSAAMVFANDKENHGAVPISSEYDYNGRYMNQSPCNGQDGDDLIDPQLL